MISERIKELREQNGYTLLEPGFFNHSELN